MAVYWIGQDGNIWLKDQSGTRNVGPAGADVVRPDATGFYDPWADPRFDTPMRFNATQINDPVNPRQVAGARTTAPSGGTAAPAPKVLNQAAVNATQAAIDSLGTEEQVGAQNIEDSYASLVGRYDRESRQNETDFGEQTTTNTQNLQKNKQNALLAAAQGRRGLRGTLASIGALSGSGIDLSNRVVTRSANEDIGGAGESFATNAQTLDKAIGRFREEDKDRRSEAETTRTNQRTALRGNLASKRQQFYQKMAEIFAGADRTGEADTWLGRAGGLNQEIAANSRVAATPFAARAAAFTPGTLESYLAGAGDMTVDVGGGAGGRSPTSILAGRRRRREEEERATA